MRKWFTGIAAGLGALSPAFARAAEASFEVLAQVTKSSSGGATRYVVPGIVTALLFAAALYVVCKTSRRV